MPGIWSWARGLLREKKEPRAVAPPVEALAPRTRLTSFADLHNDFAIALYGHLREAPGNVFFSPFSIRTALAMAYAGARGETAAQMSGALRFPPSDESLHQEFSDLAKRLEASEKPYQLSVANSLWGQDGAPVKNEFLEFVDRHYGGGMNLVDYRRAAEAARVKINSWVEDKTRNKIRYLIPPGGVDTETRLVLVNAVYFQGSWEKRFLELATIQHGFYAEGRKQVQVPMMCQCDTVRYYANDDLQAIAMDYRGGDLSMLVLLPNKRKGLPDLEKKLSPQLFRDCVEGLQALEVQIFLPKHKITWGTVDITDQLCALGMPLAFDRHRADFSGINGYRAPHEDSLVVSGVFHKSFVDVNEEGTEAAAATGVGYILGASVRDERPPVPVFLADHPFLFAIRDRKTGVILFLGRVTDPTAEN